MGLDLAGEPLDAGHPSVAFAPLEGLRRPRCRRAAGDGTQGGGGDGVVQHPRTDEDGNTR
jgi:hypothetical protein